MKERAHAIAAAVGLSLAVAMVPSTANGQVHGIPVYNSGIPTGIGVYADIGFPNTDAGKGRALALTGRAGLGPFGATAILSTFNPEGAGDNELSVGGTLNYKLFGGPLIPLAVTLQAGIGYSKPEGSFLPGVPGDTEVDELRFPVGVGLALTIPNPALAIKPWIAPRIDVVRVESETESNFGIGAGLELNTLGGFGVHAAYDRVFVDGGDPGVFGVGAHYTFRVPGL